MSRNLNLKRNPNKYGNKRCEVDGIKFASKKEARHYSLLKLLEKQGKIHGLRCQVPFTFEINGKPVRFIPSNRVMKYIADFEYFTSDGERKVVDVKGFKTPDYKIKKALMMAVHGIMIEEV